MFAQRRRMLIAATDQENEQDKFFKKYILNTIHNYDLPYGMDDIEYFAYMGSNNSLFYVWIYPKETATHTVDTEYPKLTITRYYLHSTTEYFTAVTVANETQTYATRTGSTANNSYAATNMIYTSANIYGTGGGIYHYNGNTYAAGYLDETKFADIKNRTGG